MDLTLVKVQSDMIYGMCADEALVDLLGMKYYLAHISPPYLTTAPLTGLMVMVTIARSTIPVTIF